MNRNHVPVGRYETSGLTKLMERGMSKQVTAIFGDRASAATAVDRLVAAGFARDDISALMSDATRGRHFDVESSTKAPEGAAVGAGLGGVLGAIAAGLVA
ncbi:MAG: hypothetical protein ACREL6_09005, partial [Gemmatimonadales bacterium]